MNYIKRYGLVRGSSSMTAELVGRYLPNNYKVIHEGQWPAWFNGPMEKVVVIGGYDEHGWTLDGYVIPRLGSGMMACDEVDLSHPIMKEVPA